MTFLFLDVFSFNKYKYTVQIFNNFFRCIYSAWLIYISGSVRFTIPKYVNYYLEVIGKTTPHINGRAKKKRKKMIGHIIEFLI